MLSQTPAIGPSSVGGHHEPQCQSLNYTGNIGNWSLGRGCTLGFQARCSVCLEYQAKVGEVPHAAAALPPMRDQGNHWSRDAIALASP